MKYEAIFKYDVILSEINFIQKIVQSFSFKHFRSNWILSNSLRIFFFKFDKNAILMVKFKIKITLAQIIKNQLF